MFHYTNEKGYKAISSQVVWLFKASKPPCDHPKGGLLHDSAPPDRQTSASDCLFADAARKPSTFSAFPREKTFSACQAGEGPTSSIALKTMLWKRKDRGGTVKRTK